MRSTAYFQISNLKRFKSLEGFWPLSFARGALALSAKAHWDKQRRSYFFTFPIVPPHSHVIFVKSFTGAGFHKLRNLSEKAPNLVHFGLPTLNI